MKEAGSSGDNRSGALRRGMTAVLRWLQELSHKPILRLSASLLVLFFCAVYLFEKFPDVVVDLRSVRLNGWLIAAAWLLNIALHGSGAFCWVLLLRGFGQKIDWLDGIRVNLNSSIARYVPGYIWQFVGKAYLTSEMGVPLRITNMLMAWELVMLIGCGIAVALVFIPRALIAEWGLPAWGYPAMITLGIALYGLVLAFPWFAEKVFARSLLNGLHLHKRFFFLAALIIAANWVLNGVCLWLTTSAFGIARPDWIPFHVFSFSLSLVTGILIILVPNGLGIREGMMTYLLIHLMPESLALLIATVSRLEMVTGEFAALLLAGFLHRIRQLRMRNMAASRE